VIDEQLLYFTDLGLVQGRVGRQRRTLLQDQQEQDQGQAGYARDYAREENIEQFHANRGTGSQEPGSLISTLCVIMAQSPVLGQNLHCGIRMLHVLFHVRFRRWPGAVRQFATPVYIHR